MADIIIVGAGPAGLSAAIYARRAGMDTVIYEGEMYGGQIVNTPEIENYPAIAKISGFDFANDLYNQAINLGAVLEFDRVAAVEKTAEGFEVKIAVTSGFAGADKLMKQIAKGESPYHFIEVMGCPGGCITGGGQPRPKEDIRIVRQKRLEAIYAEDERKPIRKSHENPAITEFYKEWGEPGCHKSHKYLHTTYVKRGLYNQLTDEDFVV